MGITYIGCGNAKISQIAQLNAVSPLTFTKKCSIIFCSKSPSHKGALLPHSGKIGGKL
jgi:hypothetical protein